MLFKDISNNKKTLYTLKANEKCVFYILNRQGAITFELAGENAEAHIFAFFTGKDTDVLKLQITQHHRAPRTTSRTLVKSALSDQASFSYEGLVRIEKKARLSDAAQECRTLLLSPEATSFATPSLEILNNDVKCRHAATLSSLDAEQLFSLASRSLTETQARRLLRDGFFDEALEKMEKLKMI